MKEIEYAIQQIEEALYELKIVLNEVERVINNSNTSEPELVLDDTVVSVKHGDTLLLYKRND